MGEFKADLLNLSVEAVVHKYLFSVGSAVLKPEREQSLIGVVAKNFQVDFCDVHIVGSAKLGFSIKPGAQFRPFGESSDVDVVVISEDLFRKVWKEVYWYIECGDYWPNSNQFCHYLVRGWIRPDKLPPSAVFQFTKSWNQFFRSLTSSGDFGRHPIKAGLYLDKSFATSYHCKAVSACREIK